MEMFMALVRLGVGVSVLVLALVLGSVDRTTAQGGSCKKATNKGCVTGGWVMEHYECATGPCETCGAKPDYLCFYGSGPPLMGYSSIHPQ